MVLSPSLIHQTPPGGERGRGRGGGGREGERGRGEGERGREREREGREQGRERAGEIFICVISGWPWLCSVLIRYVLIRHVLIRYVLIRYVCPDKICPDYIHVPCLKVCFSSSGSSEGSSSSPTFSINTGVPNWMQFSRVRT